MARPRKSVDQKLVPVKVNLSPARFDLFDQRARREGKPLGVVLREFLDPAFREPKTTAPSPAA